MYDYVKFHKGYFEAIEDLQEREQLAVLKAILKYGLYEEETELSGVASTIWKIIKPMIDSNHENTNNGKKGGRPKKQTETPQKDTKKEKTTQSKAEEKKDEITEAMHKKSKFYNGFWSSFENANLIIDGVSVFVNTEHKNFLLSGTSKIAPKDNKFYMNKVFDDDFEEDY